MGQKPTQTVQKEAVTAPTQLVIVEFEGQSDPVTLTLRCEFGGLIKDPKAINRLRQDLRSWFTAYVPVWEGAHNPNDFEQSIYHHELIDEFLSALVEQGINRLVEGVEGRADV